MWMFCNYFQFSIQQSSEVVTYGSVLWKRYPLYKIRSWHEHFWKRWIPVQDVPEHFLIAIFGHMEIYYKGLFRSVYSFHIFYFYVTWRQVVLLFIYKRTSWTWVSSNHWFFSLLFNLRQVVLSPFIPTDFVKSLSLTCKMSCNFFLIACFTRSEWIHIAHSAISVFLTILFLGKTQGHFFCLFNYFPPDNTQMIYQLCQRLSGFRL